ncbi:MULTISPECIES: Asp-tRNA(Asn)/Glu-tRNA(Gln) amidotransferase subunit GatB [unclassified Breznakia]|uniref:Asp-tRNA(Asn)/Glu-tRNA(Gln) amidotransferase subunit GatB n=1 Tax=unclassified Breznakia TaxID=2623764 RepID=UPI00247481E0|nr:MULTISPECIES: Asp-tRNA(Asn)/Glu-tRNA(Gln) amidotransferase subunit GatB [unclassified Breznakia]MDH6366422.1 aspartyl-tRNA(Asn)/glutamyl-tRNA(Gln) amidotransferase subunit B [Breznakia sp. PH1-1]MDH6403515.1 aspartyl-tRNA(Asn)/glutamyl-tRNA(Gln) amidotransferase subunit B [Breznakia sp. PF1-11]MDH6411224.1 aspartyl-tRNA(Asn)/glutamyl-tRNA(Gln) amidotransferase subunit B [Breznakia sp. PFB1-11]MDH6413513.1 aspartyl-tRNA(Asn)/glutamyl-tRNA(Gln) amidotransferase subunit B [Breznakia sp. PFB1-14
MNFEVIIGIEIHCELKTNTKMFSSAPLSFAATPNTCTNEIDLGMPGTLPCVNKEAVRSAVKACLATNCEVDRLIRFDRKNYYYSDLPKGFQITQQFYPIGSNGSVTIPTEEGEKVVRLNRIHMEEDTAKQFHTDEGTMIDFNRAGTPLIEIVSEPDMRNGKEAAAYVEEIRKTLYYLGVSDVRMEEGSLRCDVNISLRPYGSDVLGAKAEIKNLNSIANVQRAIEYEMKRQNEILLAGGTVSQATLRFDEATRQTVEMRKKEGAVDYKYFPEPNIFPIRIDDEMMQDIIDNMPELPKERYETYISTYELSDYDANTLVANKELSDFFNETVAHTKEYKLVANWLLGDVSAYLNKNGLQIQESKLAPIELASMINMVANKEISSKQAKEVFEGIVEGKTAKAVVKEKGMEQLSDPNAILALINQALDANPQSIEDFKNGKDRAVGFLVGQVMKLSKGQANPGLTNKLLVEELNKR